MSLLDKIPANKLSHFKWGLYILAASALLMFMAYKGWYGQAIALAATGLTIGVELYQKAHDKGTPDPWDVVAGSLPSWIGGVAVWWWLR